MALVGKVTWCDPDTGIGLIAREDGAPDVCLHHSVLIGDPVAEGVRLAYGVEPGLSGPNAVGLPIVARGANPPAPRRVGGGPRRAGSGNNQSATPFELPSAFGVVQRDDHEAGFGFSIRGGGDVFGHRSGAGPGGLQEGDRVTIRVGSGANGPRAEHLDLTDRADGGVLAPFR